MERHLSKSAKERSLHARRMQDSRRSKCAIPTSPDEMRLDKTREDDATGATAVSTARPGTTQTFPIESLQAQYNLSAKAKGLQQSRLLNDRIRQAYKVRCREIPDFPKLFLAEVAQLAEFVQEGHWFDFGWAITSPENARKLLEGKYRGVREVQPIRKTQEQLLAEYHAATGVPRRDKPAALPPEAARG